MNHRVNELLQLCRLKRLVWKCRVLLQFLIRFWTVLWSGFAATCSFSVQRGSQLQSRNVIWMSVRQIVFGVRSIEQNTVQTRNIKVFVTLNECFINNIPTTSYFIYNAARKNIFTPAKPSSRKCSDRIQANVIANSVT